LRSADQKTGAGTPVLSLRCTGCGRETGLDQLYKCPSCGRILEVQYRAEAYQRAASAGSLLAPGGDSIWSFRELLPIARSIEPVSLGEGCTALLPARRLGLPADANRIRLKLESTNPTGSFKDRPVSVAVTKAVELGVTGVITASSGNAGASVAAYAARAELPAVVLVPDGLPASKLTQIAMYGATLVAVRGHFSRAFALARQVADEQGWYNVTTTFLSAYPTEGNKTVAFELFQQLGEVPDHVLVPVGSGPLLVGALKGFRELVRLGVTDRVPAMTAIQAEGCAPIVRAFNAGDHEVVAWEDPRTVATGINDPLQGYADDGSLTLASVRDTGGVVTAVSDEAILVAAELLARAEGVFAEPTGAAAVAALAPLYRSGFLGAGDSVVALVTGHGLKDPGAMTGLLDPPIVIEPDIAKLRSVIAEAS
jgi:threonine synthase